MKRLSFIFIFLVLFMICSPLFSLAATAPFEFQTSQSAPVADSTHWYVILANDGDNGVIVSFESEVLQYIKAGSSDNAGIIFNTNRPVVSVELTRSGSFTSTLSYYDLKNGYLLSTETKTYNVEYYGGYFFNFIPSRILALTDYITYPAYGYGLGNTIFRPLSNVNVVEPFVTWNYNPDPGPGPVVDPTEIIRSRIPRPFGNGTTYYIADHLYLYSIFMGVPQQFEEQGIINTSVDPSTYEGDNINIYEVYFTGSGSSLNFTVLNHAKYSYNCTVTKYDVVDGSFVDSSSHAMTVATDADHPSTNTFSISLSDPSAYGIYQSGFFARHTSISYPELRISWSDTIDYSLDFFVIRSGITTLVEGMAQVIGGLGTANSTLSTISSTTSSILTAINNFYTLVSDNFTWLKTTYYNSILNRWDINKTQLDTIISLLEGNGQTTFPADETVSQDVDNYVSQEDEYFSQFDEAGSNADVVFDEAISQFTANSNGFSFIRMLLETFVFNIPSSYIIVFVSLTFGLVIMIIGRVVGGSKS